MRDLLLKGRGRQGYLRYLGCSDGYAGNDSDMFYEPECNANDEAKCVMVIPTVCESPLGAVVATRYASTMAILRRRITECGQEPRCTR